MEETPETVEASADTPNWEEHWKSTVRHIVHRPILCLLHALSRTAARHPYWCVISTLVASFGLLAIGWQTSFVLESREQHLWTPNDGMAFHDGGWLENPSIDKYYRSEAGSLEQERERETRRRLQDKEDATVDDWLTVSVLMHKNGDNVVTKQGADRLFEIHEIAIHTNGYKEFCQQHGESPQCPDALEEVCQLYNISAADHTCQRIGPTAFFSNDAKVYHSRATSDRDVQVAMSPSTYTTYAGGGISVNMETFFQGYQIQHLIGHPKFENENDILVSGKSYTMIFVIPNVHQGWEIAVELEDRLLDLRKRWTDEQNGKDTMYALEVTSAHAFEKEVGRGLVRDIPFVGLAFGIVAIFTMTAFCLMKPDRSKPDTAQSRSALGFGAIACVSLSIISGYGLLFCFGVPFTAIAQLLPFVMFGIGVDDAFIIMAAYDRTSPGEDSLVRIRAVIEEVGVSVAMTSVTSIIAFCLGSLSTIPAVRWLCLYAFPMVAIDLLYQCTFFVALIVIDEKPIYSRQRNCLSCSIVSDAKAASESCDNVETHHDLTETSRQQDEPIHTRGHAPDVTHEHFVQRIIILYTDFLLLPISQALVLVFFSALFAICAYSTSLLAVAFDFTSVLPGDSFVISFYDAMHTFAQDASIAPFVHFRFEDQSNPAVQKQMDAFVNDLCTQVGGISNPPTSFWLWDYWGFLQEQDNTSAIAQPFNESVGSFLAQEEYRQYWNDVVLDSHGNILSSRVKIFLDNVDLTDVDEYMGAFRAIRDVGRAQPANQEGAWSFFVFDASFYLWEFLDTTANELMHTIILGVAAVTVTTIFFMPHFLAALYVLPMIVVTFVDLLGFLQLCGISVNGVSFIALVMSIGLLVDYIMHVALRYFESAKIGRADKTKEILLTMGSSVLLGGMSTLLGTMSLAFTSTTIFYTIFVSFCGIVTIGISHGLVLFPVILSLVGPE